MRTRCLLPLLSFGLLLTIGTVNVRGAGHSEVTVIPVGTAGVEKGPHDVSYRLPMGAQGPLPQPMVLIAVQPWVTVTAPPLLPEAEQAGNAPKEQTPATIKFTINGRNLPPWVLQKQPTAYVINFDLIKANPEFGNGRLAMNMDLDTAAEGATVTVVGMPDPLLLEPTPCGPLSDLVAAATDGEVKSYLQALVAEIAGDKQSACRTYESLRAAKNERVARLARRSLRLAAYENRPYKLSGNFTEHYRWGLYLQQCGLFSAAYKEFEECRIIFPWHQDSQFRAGEMFERLAGPTYRVLDYMDRTRESSRVEAPSDWYALVAILRSRGDQVVTNQQLFDIKDFWLTVERNVAAASGGNVRIITSFYEIFTEKDRPLITRDGGYLAPDDDLVDMRGWFDGVVFVAPRLAEEAGKPSRTYGGESGIKGAALSCLFSDQQWWDYMAAFYEQFTWAAGQAELSPGLPLSDQALGAGHQPVPHIGAACRAALRYHFTPAQIRRVKLCDLPVQGSAVQLWQIEGPYPVREQPPAGGRPSLHVLDPIPPGPAPQTLPIVATTDYIDLARLLPEAGWARAVATCWVYSPAEQDVRMWLGRNDGIAAWVNGRRVYAGDAYAAGTAEDRNLTDTIASFAPLQEGWNEVRVVVEAWPPPLNQGWGFSVRFTTVDNQPVPGLAYLNRKPEEELVPLWAPPRPGTHFSWDNVRHNYREILPELGPAELEAITGLSGIACRGAVDKSNGFVVLSVPGRPDSATYRTLPEKIAPEDVRDVVLNNVLDWQREACAAIRYQKEGRDRDLLLVKPEAVEAYLTLLREPAPAAEVFSGRPPRERLLGYVRVPDFARSSRTLLVVETLLSQAGDARCAAWPTDEEDLLEPLGEYVPNAAFFPAGPPAP